ncbi:MAG: FlgD immunoglobulin-like domain containing protein [bacterium]
MKKSITKLQFCTLLLLYFIALLLPINNIAIAGDAKFKNIISPGNFVYIGSTLSVVFEIENIESYPVTDLMVSSTIKNANEEDVYGWDTTLAVLEPHSFLTLSSSPHSWLEEEPGIYTLYLQCFSEVDINPSNNSMEMEFEVKEPPEPALEFDVEQLSFKINWDHPFSLVGLINFKYGPLEDVKYVNVVGKNEKTNTVDWIVKNLALLPFDVEQKISYCFDFGKLNYLDGEKIETIDIGLMYGDSIIDNYFETDYWFKTMVNVINYDVGIDNPPDSEPSIIFELSEPAFEFTPYKTWEYRGCNVPNIELDYTRSPSSATYAGDLNACGPAAASNSMQWLLEKHPNLDDNGQSHREKMVELSKMMNRANNEGVNTAQIVKAKLAFIDKYKLPISVKYQSHFISADTIQSPNGEFGHYAKNKSDSARKPPKWDWLLSEFKNGEDIEILFGWYDSTGTRHGGHWVTVTGLSEVGNYKGLYFKDDLLQGADSGRREMFVNWVAGTGGWSRLAGFRGPNSYCWAESVVSESYDSTVTFEAGAVLDRSENIFNVSVWENPSSVDKAVNISFEITENYNLKIIVFDINGNEIAKISENNYSEGKHKIEWNGFDFSGKRVGAGTYFIVFKANGKEYTTKIIRE